MRYQNLSPSEQLLTPFLKNISYFLKRNALKITDAELKLIANAAIIGDRSHPVNGYKTPAAIGTPMPL